MLTLREHSQKCHIELQQKTISYVKTGLNCLCTDLVPNNDSFHTFPLYFYAMSKLSKSFFYFYPALREGGFIFAICPLSCGLLLSPAPLLFYPACGASSCCCCPPALCSCSSEEPLQAASRSLSQSPACGKRGINQCVYTGRDAVKYLTGTLVTLPH